MKYYKSYFKRQVVSPQLHQQLLELGEGRKTPKPSHTWQKWGALAACCALALGLGVYTLHPGHTQPPPAQITSPALPVSVPVYPYENLTLQPDLAASIAFPDGAFPVDYPGEGGLTLSQLQTIFLTKQEGFPFPLGWENYDITARAIYDGAGQLWLLTIYGEHPAGSSFSLQLSPGHLPPTCLVEPDRERASIQGTPVTLWRRSYDRNGDGITDHVCGAEFLTGAVGVRFENTGGPLPSDYGGQIDLELGGAMEFNAAFVSFVLESGGLTLEPLLTWEDIPVWEETSFSTLAQARQRAEFAPYLPSEDIPGFLTFAGNREFYGHYSYQEGYRNFLWVRWSRNCDDVEISVYLPSEGQSFPQPVDVAVPASYDWRLYDGSISDCVPPEYQADFYKPLFRAEDLSLDIIQARGRAKDTGGMAYRFYVLHENGTVVDYDCSGMTARQVWAMVEATLSPSVEPKKEGGVIFFGSRRLCATSLYPRAWSRSWAASRARASIWSKRSCSSSSMGTIQVPPQAVTFFCLRYSAALAGFTPPVGINFMA